MKKEWNTDAEFGEIPFKTVGKIEFTVSGMKNQDDAAFLQYQLLLKPEILQCHIEYSSQRGALVFNPLDTDSKTLLKGFPQPFAAELKSEKKFPYRELLAQSFHLR